MNADNKTRDALDILAVILSAPRVDLARLKKELICLLEHLSAPAGRTDENCRAVDSFFCFNETWPEMNLPSDFHDLLADMGGALHDSVSHPDIAKNFESTPAMALTRTDPPVLS